MCLGSGTRQTKKPTANFEFAVCCGLAHGKTGDPLRFQKICRVPNVCRVFCPLAHGRDVNPLRFEKFCRVVIVCRVSRSAAHGKRVLCRVPVVCRELHLRHTAKGSFAVCPSFGSRQTIGHTANIQFPVVIGIRVILISTQVNHYTCDPNR